VQAYAEFKSNGFVSYHPDQEAISRYTHLEMARKFSEVLMSSVNHATTDTVQALGNDTRELSAVSSSNP